MYGCSLSYPEALCCREMASWRGTEQEQDFPRTSQTWILLSGSDLGSREPAGSCCSEVQLRDADCSGGCIMLQEAHVSTTLSEGWWPCD